MKFTFLGSGSAFTVGQGNFQSNMLFEDEDGEKLLLDCGTDIRYSLFELGYSYLDIKTIYISHLHLDHVGGLEYMGFSTKFDPRCEKPNLIVHESLPNSLWNNLLSGCMKTLQGEEANLGSFFDTKPVGSDLFFLWQNIRFELVKTIHVIDGDQLLPSFGLFFEINGKKVFVTTDTQFSPDFLGKYFEEADIIFHDCELSKYKSIVHAHYEDLKTLPDNTKSKMWLYHYNGMSLPDAQKDGFRGFVKKGQVFEF